MRILTLLCLASLSNLAISAQERPLFATNYISLAVPQTYSGELNYLNSSNSIEIKKAGDPKHDKSYLPSFPNVVSSVTIYEVDEDGGLTLTGISLSAKNHTYEVIYDFTQTQTLEIDNYEVLIGVSVRMVARITTKIRNINLANLFGIGIAANRKKVTGSLQVRTSGISSQAINGILPVTADLSQASIATALQAVATIKSHIYDSDTYITPQFLAYSILSNTKPDTPVDINNIKSKLKTFAL